MCKGGEIGIKFRPTNSLSQMLSSICACVVLDLASYNVKLVGMFSTRVRDDLHNNVECSDGARRQINTADVLEAFLWREDSLRVQSIPVR